MPHILRTLTGRTSAAAKNMSDYNFLMESRLSPSQMQVVNYLSRAAASQGLNLYLVGGAVRDLIQGQQIIRGLDFVVEGGTQRLLRHIENPETPRNALPGEVTVPQPPAPEIVEIKTDKRLGTLQIRFRNGVRGEVASARTESFSKSGSLAQTSPAMIFDDLKRRDFSVDAMAISLHPNSRGLLLDPTNGAADIDRREFRILHSRSFIEDPSRLYRLVRLGLRLDFKPDERTRASFDLALENRVWEQMAPEYRSLELRAILEEENPGRVFKALADQKLLAGLDQKLATLKIAYDQFNKVRSAIKAAPEAEPLLLHFHTLVEKFEAADQKRLARLVFSDESEVKLALSLGHDAQALVRALSGSKASKPSGVYVLLSGKPLPMLVYLLAQSAQPNVQKRVKEFLTRVPQIRAALPRSELLALGMAPSPKFDKVMEKIFLDQLDGKLKTPQQVSKALTDLSGLKPSPPTVSAKLTNAGRPAKAQAKTSPNRNAAPSPAIDQSTRKHGRQSPDSTATSTRAGTAKGGKKRSVQAS